MKKRGQFFIMAAFIIIMIALGLSFIYIDAVPGPEIHRAEYTASEIKYELSFIVNEGLEESLSQDEINSRVSNALNTYKAEYLDLSIIVFYGLSDDIQIFDAKSDIDSTPGSEIITVTLNNGPSYDIELHEGQNVHVFVMLEKDGQRFISQK